MAMINETYAEQKTPSSPFDRLAEATEMLREVRKHADALASRLAGDVPEKSGSASSLSPVANGLFGAMDESVRQLRSCAEDIRDSLRRIENRL